MTMTSSDIGEGGHAGNEDLRALSNNMEALIDSNILPASPLDDSYVEAMFCELSAIKADLVIASSFTDPGNQFGSSHRIGTFVTKRKQFLGRLTSCPTERKRRHIFLNLSRTT